MKIFKYPINGLECKITLPNRSLVVSIERQHGRPVLYAMIDPTDTETREITVHGFFTGQDIPEKQGLVYQKTILGMDDRMVIHYFI